MIPLLTAILVLSTAKDSTKIGLSLPVVKMAAHSKYLTYAFTTKKENWYFLIEIQTKRVIAIEFNGQHDTGESWLDTTDEEIQTNFKLNGKVEFHTIKSGPPLSSSDQLVIRKLKEGSTVQINGQTLSTKSARPGFVFLGSPAS
jgi:hypothetical protein